MPGRRGADSPALDPEEVAVGILERQAAQAAARREGLSEGGHFPQLERPVGRIEVVDLERHGRGVLDPSPFPPAVEAERDALDVELHPAGLLVARRDAEDLLIPPRGPLGIADVEDDAFDRRQANSGRPRRRVLASHAPSSGLLDLEHDRGIADRDEVAVIQLARRDLLAVHEGPVVALEILEQELPRPLPDLAMAPRAVAVAGDRDVDLRAPSEDGHVVDQGDDLSGKSRRRAAYESQDRKSTRLKSSHLVI